MTAWRMAFRTTDGESLWPVCSGLGVAAIEYPPLDGIDLSRHAQCEPRSAWTQLKPTQKASVKRFAYEMQQEHVIYVKEGPMIVGKGIVSGPYKFDTSKRIVDPEGYYWEHQRLVTWSHAFSPVRILVGRNQQFVVEQLTDQDVARIEGYSAELDGGPTPYFVDEGDIEGLRTEHLVTTAERSRSLRDKALRVADGRCAVCQRDFGRLLGGRGVRVLQVHHRDQLSNREVPSVTKLTDLVVVCANCHLLLHLDRDKALRVEELHDLLREESQGEATAPCRHPGLEKRW